MRGLLLLMKPAYCYPIMLENTRFFTAVLDMRAAHTVYVWGLDDRSLMQDPV